MMHLDPIGAAAMPPAPAPDPARRRCGDCPAVIRPERSAHYGADARCAETLHHRILGANWQPKDAAPWWCPREAGR